MSKKKFVFSCLNLGGSEQGLIQDYIVFYIYNSRLYSFSMFIIQDYIVFMFIIQDYIVFMFIIQDYIVFYVYNSRLYSFLCL